MNISPRIDSERSAERPSAVPFSDLERIEAFASSTAASSMYAKDVATFRDARKKACDALAAAEALGRAYRLENAGGEKKKNRRRRGASDAGRLRLRLRLRLRERKRVSFFARGLGPRPSVRAVRRGVRDAIS